VTVRFTSQGCKVQTTCVICPNGRYTEHVVLSVDPASALAIETEENAGREIGTRETVAKTMRVRSTKFGFELIERRP
jgi:hypothetical protein